MVKIEGPLNAIGKASLFHYIAQTDYTSYLESVNANPIGSVADIINPEPTY
jgi:hypothetical protein